MLNKILVLAFVSFISSCGGGGGSNDTTDSGQPTTTERIAGIWQGTGNDVGDVGIVTENGDLFFISIPGNTLTVGRITSASGDNALGTLSSYAAFGFAFPDGSTVATGTFNATVKTRSTLTGTTSSKFGADTFSFAYDTDYDLPSSLSLTAGTWSGIDFFGDLVTLTINSSGVITGSDSASCIYSGQVSIINTSFNAYNFVLTLSNCGSFNGSFSGVSTMDSIVSTNDTLTYGVSTPLIILVQSLTKQ